MKIDMNEYWKILKLPIELLELTSRTLTKLHNRTDIRLIGDLVYTNTDLLKVKHFGRVALLDVRDNLDKLGLWESKHPNW